MTVEEFNKTVDLHADNLYRFILKNIKDSEKAHDIVYDTCEKLWLKVSEVESTNAKSYMFTAAYRTMIDRIRRDKKQGEMTDAPENNSIVKIEEPKVNNEQPTNPVIISKSLRAESRSDNQPTDFLSLKEVVAQKLKEKTLDDESVAIQKKNGRVKRFNGWDLAQIVSREISKITGRNVEVKPTYNDDGDVTAYALGGGVQITRGK